MLKSSGAAFRQLVAATKTGPGMKRRPFALMGTVNAYCALMAEKNGVQATYLSGSGVATASFGLPDLGITNLDNVVEDVRRIKAVSSLPLTVDIDTGFGGALGIARTIRELERAGAAAVHLEDQVTTKRCGHRPGKEVVRTGEMVDRIRAAVHARRDPGFVIMARTDSLALEGLDKAIDRMLAYVDAGADMLFPEAFTKLSEYKRLGEALEANGMDAPYLANITEFGKTPLFTGQQLGEVGVSMVLYPLSAHRAMAKAAEIVYRTILKEDCQASCLDSMQSRDELYNYLDYYKYEAAIDRLMDANDPADDKQDD